MTHYATNAHNRLQGHPTRGKTAQNRLRRVDIFLLMYDTALLCRADGPFARALFVDLGYGVEPFTTLESATRLRRVNPSLAVLGVEIDPERVTRALPFANNLTQFRLGGFDVPLDEGETVRIIRAFNVLRQYDETRVRDSWQIMGYHLLTGGLLIEGTSDPMGRLWVANLFRRTRETLVYEGLLFSTNFRWGFEPGLFQPVLPKNCIRRVIPGEKVFDFMHAWNQAAQATMAYKDFGLRQWFIASAHALALRGFSLDLRHKFLRQGYLLWKDGPEAAPLPLNLR